MYKPSNFIPTNLQINSWDDLKPYFEKLLNAELNSVADLEQLILNDSEVYSVYSEQNARAYIAMTCDTEDKSKVERHEMFSTQIAPKAQIIGNKIQKKIVESPYFKELDPKRYEQVQKELKRDLELFNEENVEIEAQISKLESEYGQLAGSIMVKLDGEELTMPQAAVKLQSQDRSLRERTFNAIKDVRMDKKQAHDDLFNKMIELRQKVAANAGYKNYRDYKHDALHRFDYKVDDVLEFHKSIQKYCVPLKKMVTQNHRQEMKLSKEDYRPWDTAVKPDGKELKPFKDGKDLLDKGIKIFSKIRPEFGDNLKKMDEAGLFDLDSRKGKAPGGYNYGLQITGMPFIFMNSAGVHRDVITLMHEGGHAMHTFLCNDEPLIHYRNTPSEMAETASMSMELMSSTHWNEFYNEDDLKKARKEHLEDVIDVLPWVATVDAFQHWIYTNPGHTVQERDAEFDRLMEVYGTGEVNWSGYEDYRKNLWQKQLHIFEVPFYYIEYAIAQLGALQIYRNYKKDPQAAIDDYIRGLSMGSSRPMPEIWDAMNIKFDFSEKNVSELMAFVAKEYEDICK